MTWEMLAEKIAGMTPEQKQTNVTVLLMNTDEICPIVDFVQDWTTGLTDTEKQALGADQVDGVLDDDHPYMTVDF